MKTIKRTPRRVQKTHDAVAFEVLESGRAVEDVAVLVAENKRACRVFVMSRAELVEHVRWQIAKAMGATRFHLARLVALLRRSPPHRAPVVIACIEGVTILQWLEAA